MKIGIMGAMFEEISSIKDLMNISNETQIADRIYYEGTLGHHDIVLAFSRWGKVASSSTATTMLNVFGVHSIIFTGVAGAVNPNLNIGDIVIADTLYQHDMDARPIYNQFQIPLLETTFFKPCTFNINKAENAVGLFLKDISQKINSELLSKYSIKSPKIHIGTIASGDQFFSSSQKHKQLTDENQHVLAVEMEGAAVAQVCHEHKIPYTVIRIISDKANHTASIDFQSFVADIASVYSAGILSKFFENNI